MKISGVEMKFTATARQDLENVRRAWREFWLDLRRDPVTMFGLFLAAMLIAFLMLLPWLADDSDVLTQDRTGTQSKAF